MLKKLFGRAGSNRRATVDAIYERIVAAARQPVFYADWHVPDTPLGRFEMLSLHVFLYLHRLQPEGAEAREVAQGVTDEFFKDVEHSLRELGIGDMGVPKRMKKLARMFYGRAASYGEALDAGDEAALAAALSRNVRPGEENWSEANALAAYAAVARTHLAALPVEDLLTPGGFFPAPGQGTAS